jgi:HEAT repeat protein
MMTLLLCLASLLPVQDSSEREIRELISRLGDDNPERRNESYRKLKQLRQAALPQLRKAAEEGDREIRAHASRLLTVFGVMEKLPASLLQVAPGIEERLKPGGGETWTEAFLQLPADKEGPTLRNADLSSLAVEAAKGASTPEQRTAFIAAARTLNNRSVAAGLLVMVQAKGHEDGRRAALDLLIDLGARAELLEAARPPGQMPETVRKGDRLEDFEESRQFVQSLNLGHQAFYALRSMGARSELRAMLKDGKVRGFPGDAAQALAEMGEKDAIPEIVALLSVLDGYERYKVARALGDLEARESIPDIAKLIDDPLGAPRAGAFYALGRLGSRKHIPAMIAHLNDKRSAVRVAAAEALGVLAATEARQPLLDALKDSDPTMRAISALALTRIQGEGIAEGLVAKLEDDEAVVRIHAAVALIRRGSRKGAPSLLRFAEKPVPLYLNVSCEGFGGGMAPSFNPLMELNALRSPETWNRLGKVRLSKDATGIIGPDLGQFARDASLMLKLSASLAAEGKALEDQQYFAVPPHQGLPLLTALQYYCQSRQLHAFIVDGDRLIVMTTAEAIQSWKQWYVDQAAAEPAEKKDAALFTEELRRAALTPEARKAIEDKEARESRQAHRAERVKAIGELLRPGLKAIPGAEDALLDGDDHVWTELLLKTKPDGPLKGKDLDVLAVKGLRGAASADERAKAALAAGELQARGAVEELVGLLSEPEPSVRISVLGTLGSLGSDREVPQILSQGRDPHPGVRMAAAQALYRLNSKECWPIVLGLTRHPDYGIREPAVMFIALHGGPEFVPDMIPMLKYATNFSNAAQWSIRYLSRHGAREAVPDLIAVYEAKGSRCIREAQAALYHLGAREAIPAFLKSFKAGDNTVAPDLATWEVKEIVPELRRRLKEKDPRSNLASIALALARFGDQESAPLLSEILADEGQWDRRGIALPLARLEGTKARAKLLAAPDPHGTLDLALAAVGAKEAIPVMTARLDKWCRDETIGALMELGASEALPKIFEILKTPDESYNYWNALRAVFRAYPKESLPTCRIYLKSCKSSNRDLAAGFLCEAGSREAVGLLLEQPASSPLSLNALRNPEAWERLSRRKKEGTRYASRRDLAAELARDAGMEFVDLPVSANDYKAWINGHQEVGNPYRPASLLDWLEPLEELGWGFVLEGTTLRVLPRDEAAKLWRDWWSAEKSR